MRRFITHLFVALLTFAFGIVASMLFGGGLTSSVKKVDYEVAYVTTAPAQEAVVRPLHSSCGCNYEEGKVGAGAHVPSPTASISGGILNGKARSLPKPAYPAIAKAARAQGTVTVQVVIDEQGCVQSARAVGGHPLLQAAATQAASEACFTPTLLSGEPVKVTGVVTYHFVGQ